MFMRVNLKYGLVAAAALLSTTAVAVAADAARPPVRSQLATLYDWTGFYAGGHVGVGWTAGDDSGVFGGGQAGVNYQIGNWVLGLEGELGTSSTNVSFMSTLAGRVGWAFNRWLVYGKLGGAWADIDNDVCGVKVRSCDKTASGLLLGVGAEYALQNNWSAKFEYNRVDIDDKANIFKVGLNYRFGVGPLSRR